MCRPAATIITAETLPPQGCVTMLKLSWSHAVVAVIASGASFAPWPNRRCCGKVPPQPQPPPPPPPQHHHRCRRRLKAICLSPPRRYMPRAHRELNTLSCRSMPGGSLTNRTARRLSTPSANAISTSLSATVAMSPHAPVPDLPPRFHVIPHLPNALQPCAGPCLYHGQIIDVVATVAPLPPPTPPPSSPPWPPCLPPPPPPLPPQAVSPVGRCGYLGVVAVITSGASLALWPNHCYCGHCCAVAAANTTTVVATVVPWPPPTPPPSSPP
jgi:hypothetical protein